MNVLRITALGLMCVTGPLHADFSLPDLGATQLIFPERSEEQLNPDPDVFPPGPELFFGYALALRGNELLVGMPLYRAGRVAVFTREHSGPWARTGSLDPAGTAQAQRFGTDIALGKNIALVQADNGTYVFHRKKGAWSQTQTLPVRFGSMAISDGFVFGGVDETVAVFRPDKRGRLQRVQTLAAEDGLPDASFGASLAVSRDTLVVGAPGDVSGRGSVYIFKRHGHTWLKRQQLIAINGEPGDGFGSSVAIAAGLIAIGAPGAQSHGPDCLYVRGVAYAFAPARRGLWFEQQKVETPVCEPWALEFAFHVAVSRDRIAAEIPAQFPNQVRRAFIYERRDGIFTPVAITSGDLEEAGQAMQMSASTLVLGWPFRRIYSVGYAAIFELGRRCLADATAAHEDDDANDQDDGALDREQGCHR